MSKSLHPAMRNAGKDHSIFENCEKVRKTRHFGTTKAMISCSKLPLLLSLLECRTTKRPMKKSPKILPLLSSSLRHRIRGAAKRGTQRYDLPAKSQISSKDSKTGSLQTKRFCWCQIAPENPIFLFYFSCCNMPPAKISSFSDHWHAIR